MCRQILPIAAPSDAHNTDADSEMDALQRPILRLAVQKDGVTASSALEMDILSDHL
jgi:hypothetical protein